MPGRSGGNRGPEPGRLSASADGPPRPPSRTAETAPPAPADLLVADGDPEVCRSYADCLIPLGYRVRRAHTGRDVLEQGRLARPDLFITDAQLPDMDGLEAAEELCRDLPLPILLIAAERDPPLLLRALGLPVLAWLVKPVAPHGLEAAVAVARQRFTEHQAACREAAELRKALEERKQIERAKGVFMKRTGLDEKEAFRRLRKAASETNRRLADVAAALLEADEVFRQVEQAGNPPPEAPSREPGR